MLIVGMINRYKEWEIGQKRMNCTEKCAELSVKLCWKCAIWGEEPKHIVIAGVLRTALANKRIQRSELEKQAMETVINALVK